MPACKGSARSWAWRSWGLFGSFVRDEVGPDSDVDLLVDFQEGRKSLHALVDLGDFLEAVLGRKVELLTRPGLSPYIGPRILVAQQMSSPPPLERLMHIRDEVLFLKKCRDNHALGTIIHDEVLSRAVVRSLEIIGEATKNVPMAWREAYPQVKWKGIAGIRDRMIRHYFYIDFEIIGEVFVQDLDALGDTVRLMLQELG